MNSMASIKPTPAAPHTHGAASIKYIMLNVCLALTPATLFGFYLFGWPAFFLWITCCASAMLTELFCLLLQNKSPSRVLDSSALLTGWLLAMTLPPWAPWWIGAGGAACAIALGKQLYGGLGHNIFNPAMLARVALLISFPVHMTTWIAPDLANLPDFTSSLAITFANAPLPDGVTGATVLGELKSAYPAGTVESVINEPFSWLEAGTGLQAGSLAETSELLVLLGGFWLLYLRIISWHIPVALLCTVTVLAIIFNAFDPSHYANAAVHLGSGGIVLAAFFIATDYVTSPSSKSAQLVFGIGCGFIIYIIRCWGGFPEGIGFAVLFMNALTPLLDRYFLPRKYGRNWRGDPIQKKELSNSNTSGGTV